MGHRFLRFFQGLCLYFLTGVLCAGAVNAVGLGRIKVYSYLNEPLDAEIELLAASSVVDSLLVSVASADEFERANVVRVPLLDKLMFQIIRDEDEIFIHATSKTWVTEPYLDFLLNLSWGQGIGQGRLIRRYTILLDPIPPEGKPVYAKRRLMPNSIEQPTAGARKARFTGAAAVTDLAAAALTETEKGIPLTDSEIPVGIVAQTPQEKLANLSKQKTGTTAGVGASAGEAKTGNADRDHMNALFEHHDKGADLKTVIEDVERVIVASRSPEADMWFNEHAAAANEQPASTDTHLEAGAVTAPGEKPSAATAATAATPAVEKASTQPDMAKTAETAAPAVTPEKSEEKSETANAGTAPVPEVVTPPAKKLHLQDYTSLIATLVITFLAGFLVLWKRWKQRRQFSATRERLAQLSREAIDEERALAAGDGAGETDLGASEQQEGVAEPVVQTQANETQQAAAVADEPLDMAAVDLVLGDDQTVPMPPELPPVEGLSNPPAAEAAPAVEEIQIDLDLSAPPPPAPTPATSAPTGSASAPSTTTASSPADAEEMALKLQLARQYIDLGDFAGAKELLMLINTQGNAEQRTEAQELLEKIV